MKSTLLLLSLSLLFTSNCQVLFSEPFGEVDNTTSGTDDAGSAVTWTALCPGSLDTEDYFKVLSGKLEGRDTNSPATFETGSIDISSCIYGLTLSFDIEEDGDLEACLDCPGFVGDGCIDWIKAEYNLDGGGWMDVVGFTCPTLSAAPGELIQIGNLLPVGTTFNYTSPCLDFGTSMRIRISVLNNQTAEFWRIDNIALTCTDCLLPTELTDLSATISGQKSTLINWSTQSEKSNDYFDIERSTDGINFSLIGSITGAGNSSRKIDYQFKDTDRNLLKTNYYRLKQYDFDGNNETSAVVFVLPPENLKVYFSNGAIVYNHDNNVTTSINLEIYNLNGQLLKKQNLTSGGKIPWTEKGVYLIKIPSLNFHQKLMTH